MPFKINFHLNVVFQLMYYQLAHKCPYKVQIIKRLCSLVDKRSLATYELQKSGGLKPVRG